MQTHYIYLLQEREFIKTSEAIYKVGRTQKEHLIRFEQYPKGSMLLFQMICNDSITTELQILKLFKTTFTQRLDIGTEYFEGDFHKMMDIIYNTITDVKDEVLADTDSDDDTDSDYVEDDTDSDSEWNDNEDIDDDDDEYVDEDEDDENTDEDEDEDTNDVYMNIDAPSYNTRSKKRLH